MQEALHRYGIPEVFNTEQASQFTSLEFRQPLKDHDIAVSMGSKDCWRDNVFIERLWKSINYEDVYLSAYDNMSAARSGIRRYLEFYNSRRPHSALDGDTSDAFTTAISLHFRRQRRCQTRLPTAPHALALFMGW